MTSDIELSAGTIEYVDTGGEAPRAGARLIQDQPSAAQSAETDRMDERLDEEVERCALAVLGHGFHGRTFAGARQ